jgi:hypothetical protein
MQGWVRSWFGSALPAQITHSRFVRGQIGNPRRVRSRIIKAMDTSNLMRVSQQR